MRRRAQRQCEESVRKPGRIIVRTSGALLVGLVVVAAAAQFMPLQKTEIPQVRENTTVISKDGTRIAVSKLGHGRPLVLIDGAFCYRGNGPSPTLAPLLADHFTVYAYDRRGRGDSGDTPPYAIDHEVEDFQAVLEAAGGSASVFAMSSGAGLALRAAVQGLRITKLALYEPPYVDRGDPELRLAQAAEVRQMAASGDRSGAVTYFMTKVFGAPGPAVFAMRVLMPRVWKKNASVAHTLAYDLAILADRAVLADAARLNVRTLIIGGEKSPQELRDALSTVRRAVPNSEITLLPGQSHNVSMKVLAPVLVPFFSAQ